MRNATSHTYNEARAIEVATGAMRFVPYAIALLAALEKADVE